METTLTGDQTVAEIVTSNYRTAEVFKQHGIDFCCGGKKVLAQVCAEKNIHLATLLNALEVAKHKTENGFPDAGSWSLTFLSDYIVNVHHKYVTTNLPLISEYVQKVATVHGSHNPETVQVAALWREVAGELSMHMQKEELVLFPYIRNLERYQQGELSVMPLPHFNSVRAPIAMMEHEHDVAGGLMKQIEALSNNFIPPLHACNTYRVLYAKLEEFQNDLHRHIHLENNILFPRAIRLEALIAAA